MQVCACRLALGILACQAGLAILASGQNVPTTPETLRASSSELVVYVRTPTGEPLNVSAIVQLLSFDGTPRLRTTTQGNAPVIFPKLATGSYYVEVSAPGYRTTREEANLVLPIPTEVEIYLRPESGPTTQSTPEGPPLLAPKARKEVDQGLEALRANDLKEAQKRLGHAAELAPGHPDVFYLLGVLYIQLNELARAKSVLEKAVQLDPKHARSLAALGTVLSRQNDYAAAVPVLEKAVALNDRAWETQWTLARADYHQRRFEEARAHAQQALSLAHGKAPEIQLLLAQALAALGQREKAAQELESFLRNHPDHAKAPLARHWLAQLHQNR